MKSNIGLYQKVYNNLINKLREEQTVIAVLVFGSVVSGDIWEGSDVDLFVIGDKENNNIDNIYMEEERIPIHIKYMSKRKFLDIFQKDLKGGLIYRLIISSKLVFSKDTEITAVYDHGRYYPDIDRERWNLVYLGNVLKSIGTWKKNIHNDNIAIAYISSIKALEDFCKLYVNFNGYMISSDTLTMTCKIDENIRAITHNLLFYKDEENLKKDIKKSMMLLEQYLEKNLRNISKILLVYFKEYNKEMSSEEAKNISAFNEFDIDMEQILEYLYHKKLIKKDERKIKLFNDGYFKEKVYRI